MFLNILGWKSQDHSHEVVFNDMKVRTRSDSIYSEYNEDDFDDEGDALITKPKGAASFASFMNLTNTCIGAVIHTTLMRDCLTAC